MGVSTDRKWHLVLKGGKLDSKGISHVRISFTCIRDCIPTVKEVIVRPLNKTLPLQTIKSVAMQNIDLSKQGHPFKDSGLDQGFGAEHQLLDTKVAQLLIASGAVVHVGD